MTFRTITVEDDRRYRESLEELLGSTPDFALAGSFASAEAALEGAGGDDGEAWNLVLMDVELPGMDGIAATRRMKRLNPDALVVVLTVFDEPDTILEAICAGADGYLAKRSPAEEILDELRSIMAGGSPLSPGVARTVLRLLRRFGPGPTDGRTSSGGRPEVDLTEREQDVLRCLVEGLPYKQAADRLGISHNTVRSHVRNIYGKLQVQNVAQAVSRALREGLV